MYIARRRRKGRRGGPTSCLEPVLRSPTTVIALLVFPLISGLSRGMPSRPHAYVQLSLDDFGIALGTYAVAHYSLVGWNSLDSTAPIPASIPADLPNMTFLEYLQALGLDVLQNIFT